MTTEQRAWDGSASNYTDQQYQAACVLDRADCGEQGLPIKERFSLPIKAPGSDSVDPDGLAAAAQRFGQVEACPKAKQNAARKIMAAYRELGLEPPASMMEGRTAPEQRTIDVDVEDVDTRGRTLHGYAAVYGALSGDLGGFKETISPGAFRDVVGADVRCLLNHDPSQVLGRSKSGTLRLADETRGLRFECDLPDSPLGENVRAAVKRGDIDGASFRFVVGKEDWDGDVRTIRSVKELHDVTVATYGAYPDASVELRTRPEATASTTAAEEPQEGSMETENNNTEAPEERVEGGGLQIENRVEAFKEEPMEHRVLEGLRNVSVGEVRSLTTTSGSAIAPPELSNYLFDKLRATSVALATGIKVVTTDRESVTWPKLSTDVVPTFYSEAGTITAGDPAFTEVTATPAKIAHIIELSNELIDDSEPAAVDTLNSHLNTMLGLKLDAAIYTGGTAEPGITGLENVTSVQRGGTIIVGGTASYDPFINAVGLLRAANAPEPYVSVVNPAILKAFGLLKNGTLSEQLAPPREMPEVHWTTQISGTAFVYSPSQVVLVRRQDATIELDRSRLFNSDQSELRGKLRADLVVPNPTAVVTLTIGS